MRVAARTAFLGRVLVVARLGALGGAAAAPLVGPLRADAGVAGALLAEQLLGAAGHLAAAQRRVRARPLVGQVHQHDFVQQLLVDLAAEVGGVDLDRPDRLALAVEHRQRRRFRSRSRYVGEAIFPFLAEVYRQRGRRVCLNRWGKHGGPEVT